jgi:hypothetical protein
MVRSNDARRILEDADVGVRRNPIRIISSLQTAPNALTLHAAEWIDGRAARGKSRVTYGRLLRCITAIPSEGVRVEEFYTYRDGLFEYVSLNVRRDSVAVFRDEMQRLSVAYANTRVPLRYEWGCTLGYEGQHTVRIPVERDAVPELFRLRDIPNGASRRAALRHFVTAHFRRGASLGPREDPTIFVKKHLRGQTRFTWNGLVCEILPPAYDAEQIAR